MEIEELKKSVFHLLRDLKQEGLGKRVYSDIIDEDGRQYVDLVMEGGGVWGIALMGYTYILEELGIRFIGFGGTSAGSINAMLMAAQGDYDKPKTDKLLELLANQSLADFMDGDNDAQDFIETFVLSKDKPGTLKAAWTGWNVVDNFRDYWGLNPGQSFLEFMTKALEEMHVKSQGDLDSKLSETPTLFLRGAEGPTEIADFKARIALVTTELITQTKVDFPRMGKLFWANPKEVNPALYVRASMSVPLFFVPMKVNDLPDNTNAMVAWDELASYRGEVPEKAYFVDGGLISNFPIDLFHSSGVPRMPTFGAKLGLERNEPNGIANFYQFLGSMVGTMRHVHDYTFLTKNKDYKKLIHHIKVDDFNWLDFNMSDDDKIELFQRGAEAAAEFLRRFNWEAYKELRASLKRYEDSE